MFRGWAETLAPNAEVCSIQLPGREARLREPLVSTIPDLVPSLVDALLPLLDRPYMIYGHSLGARIAFETVRQLRRLSLSLPAHLFVGACPAPHLPWQHARLSGLDDNDFLREIQLRYGGIPAQVIADREMRELLLPILRADVDMLESYDYDATALPLECGITAFGGTEDRMVRQPVLAEWRHQTCSAFRLRMLPGDHFFLQTARRQLMDEIAAQLLGMPEAELVSNQNCLVR